MELLTLITSYLLLIRIALLTVSNVLLFTAFSMIALRAYNMKRLDFHRGGKESGDHREHVRYSTMGVVEFSEAENGQSGPASLMNLSAKGVSFLTPHFLQIGQKIACRVCAYNKQPERVVGTVMWVKPKTRFFQYGVKFNSMIPQFLKPTHVNPYIQTQNRAWGTSH